jgi:hypothetical protein
MPATPPTVARVGQQSDCEKRESLLIQIKPAIVRDVAAVASSTVCRGSRPKGIFAV